MCDYLLGCDQCPGKGITRECILVIFYELKVKIFSITTHRWGIIAPRCGAPAPKGSAQPCATGAQRPYVGASAVGYL